MKKVLSLLLVIASTLGISNVFAQSSKTESFKVYGNCNMCKKRIEKAVTGANISKAEWNVGTKMMTISYDPTKISNEAIQNKIAAAGHDTEKATAPDSVYTELPGCCLYDRKANGASGKATQHH
ncbi:copper chaperone [Chitinophaga silvatica]|uniref:Copper chaperone n=1 Tax=Chitinophaga silvatica TaxID=2282649 RepID=A0A3E1Y459_9BACT|nr:heavy-metal-associated domain-containing protein [Chitinophaga silvatica]RFS19459.1 copper chaperone [Chitinophaga silvatica]